MLIGLVTSHYLEKVKAIWSLIFVFSVVRLTSSFLVNRCHSTVMNRPICAKAGCCGGALGLNRSMFALVGGGDR